MCLKSITPIARISVRVCVCVSPKDVITMVIQKPVDYVVEKIRLIYTLPLVRYMYSKHTHYWGVGHREHSSYFVNPLYWLFVVVNSV